MKKEIRYTLFVLLLLPMLLYGGLVTGKTKYTKFEAGDQILFATDFRECPVGEFPEGFDRFEKAIECVKYNNTIWIAPSTDNGMRL